MSFQDLIIPELINNISLKCDLSSICKLRQASNEIKNMIDINTIKILKEAKTKNKAYSDVDFIINVVSDVTGVDKERILHGIDRNDERKIALSLAIFYIKKQYSYGYSELKKI